MFQQTHSFNIAHQHMYRMKKSMDNCSLTNIKGRKNYMHEREGEFNRLKQREYLNTLRIEF